MFSGWDAEEKDKVGYWVALAHVSNGVIGGLGLPRPLPQFEEPERWAQAFVYRRDRE